MLLIIRGNGMDIHILPSISALLGLYLVSQGLWELRVGFDRKKFITFRFSGLCLIFVLPEFLGFQIIYNPL